MSNVSRFAAGFGRRPRRSPSFRRPRHTPQALDRAALHHYWHPDRPSVELVVTAIAQELARISPKLRCVRPPAAAPIHTGYHPWIVWFQNPEITHPLCPGWSLVFIWENPYTHEPLPLDNRLYANCYMRDPSRFANGAAYFDSCMAQKLKEEASAKAITNQETFDRQKGLYDYQKIKNIGSGSKFALHHDGTPEPSRGETSWRTETLYDRLPGEVRDIAEREGKNTKRRVTSARDSGTRGDHRMADHEMRRALDLLRLKKETRELIGVRLRRSSVGSSGASR